MSGGEHPATPSRQPATMPAPGAPTGMVWIPGGDFLMGSDDFYPEDTGEFDWELVVATERARAELHMKPLYDPAGERVKG